MSATTTTTTRTYVDYGQGGRIVEMERHWDQAKQLVAQLDGIRAAVAAAPLPEHGPLLQRFGELLNDGSALLPAAELARQQSWLQQQGKEHTTKPPTTRFSFRSRSKPIQSIQSSSIQSSSIQSTSIQSSSIQSTSIETPSSIESASISDDATIADVEQQTIKWTSSTPLCLARLSHCTVVISSELPSLRLVGLSGCRVLAGLVAGSVYVDGCRDVVLVVAAQQLRVHDSRACDFYVGVWGAGSIVEDCSGLRFAPYLSWLPADDERRQLAAVKLTPADLPARWQQVRDFNHLATAAEKPSPNWSVIEPSDRLLVTDLAQFQLVHY